MSHAHISLTVKNYVTNVFSNYDFIPEQTLTKIEQYRQMRDVHQPERTQSSLSPKQGVTRRPWNKVWHHEKLTKFFQVALLNIILEPKHNIYIFSFNKY